MSKKAIIELKQRIKSLERSDLERLLISFLDAELEALPPLPELHPKRALRASTSNKLKHDPKVFPPEIQEKYPGCSLFYHNDKIYIKTKDNRSIPIDRMVWLHHNPKDDDMDIYTIKHLDDDHLNNDITNLKVIRNAY